MTRLWNQGQLIAGRGMDVRPHPHIGLATVTYLFDGRVMHRDSEGNALEITPGAMNLMTAGRGIAHSERSPLSARQGSEGLFGIQSWIALPQAQEEPDPSFQHFDAASLPTIEDDGVRARVIAGSAFGRTSPVGLRSEWLYAEVSLAAGARAPLDPDPEERAIYVVEGEVEIADVSRRRGIGGPPLYLVEFRVLAPGADRASQRRWKTGKFAPVPGETEFIPLPES
jgi:redox-sensitive bicupin YhaK (pirin superfamily)